MVTEDKKGVGTVRFMVIIKATKDSETGVMLSEQLLTEIGKFNEELVKAGVMLAGEGLRPSSKGMRVTCSGNEHTVQVFEASDFGAEFMPELRGQAERTRMQVATPR